MTRAHRQHGRDADRDGGREPALGQRTPHGAGPAPASTTAPTARCEDAGIANAQVTTSAAGTRTANSADPRTARGRQVAEDPGRDVTAPGGGPDYHGRDASQLGSPTSSRWPAHALRRPDRGAPGRWRAVIRPARSNSDCAPTNSATDQAINARRRYSLSRSAAVIRAIVPMVVPFLANVADAGAVHRAASRL